MDNFSLVVRQIEADYAGILPNSVVQLIHEGRTAHAAAQKAETLHAALTKSRDTCRELEHALAAQHTLLVQLQHEQEALVKALTARDQALLRVANNPDSIPDLEESVQTTSISPQPKRSSSLIGKKPATAYVPSIQRKLREPKLFMQF